jgi:hypothetical protein
MLGLLDTLLQGVRALCWVGRYSVIGYQCAMLGLVGTTLQGTGALCSDW